MIFNGKTVIVTGGSQGVGAAAARKFAEAGANLMLVARSKKNLEALAGELRDKTRVECFSMDVSDLDACIDLFKKTQFEFDRIDVLVNNSVARPMKDGFDSDASTFAHSMQVNATGLFIITRAFGDAMARRGSGSIINIGSIQGMVGPDPSIYRGTSMSGWAPDYFFHKGGMINFTRFIGSYYGQRNVRCNCVAPGGYLTKDHPTPFVRQYSDKTFLGRLANDTDLMGVIVFLASDASVYITGATIPVDGGYTAK